ncbi:MAG: hypothetical protein JJE55_13275 [Flavobacteriaceae bacterium]|nr:hypothetical protein [Flavobacteriaceae bacterium]
MKKFRILYLIGLIAIITSSCETHDDYNPDRKTIIGFSQATRNINSIPEGGSRSSTVKVFVSDMTDADRTFNVIVVPVVNPDLYPPTAPENYSFSPTVVIPANTREAELEITGIDVSLTDVRTYFSLGFESTPDVIAGAITLIGLKN